jgi:ADP-heptose:LPS heptosyltransferase
MNAMIDATPRKSLTILIVQLGEVEEVFRSLMAVKAVHHLYPETRFQFLVRPSCAAPLQRVEWIDAVIPLPLIEVADDAVKTVALWVNQVIDRQVDILLNWTWSKPHLRMSSIVTTLLPATVKFGNHVRNDFTIGGFDAWSIYREAWLRDQTIDQDIHHTDIITTQLLTAMQIHAGEPEGGASASSVTSRYFFKVPVGNALPKIVSKWIAVHPDSLNDRYEEVVEMILRRHPDHGVVILNDSPIGTDSGIPLDHPRVMNLSGQLNFDQLIAVMVSCSWLIAGRAPIVDLANLINVRTLYWIESQPSITGESNAKWTEVGPYGNGNIALRFAGDFEPEVFYSTWAYCQSEWSHKGSLSLAEHFENHGVSSRAKGIEIYKSRIRSPQEGGGVTYENLLTAETTFEEWMFRLRGQVARSWFCGWIPPVDQEMERLRLNPELIKRIRQVRDSLSLIEQVCQQGKSVSKELADLSQKIRNPKIMAAEDREAIDAHGKKLLELEALISRVVNVERELRGFLVWYQYLMHNLRGDTLREMAMETHHSFELLEEGIQLVTVYVVKALDKAKPKAVSISENVSTFQEQ